MHHRRGRPPLGHLGHLAPHALHGITAAAGTAAGSVAADTGHRPAHATCRQGRRGPDGGVAEAAGVGGREEGLTLAAPVRCRTPVGVPARPARWSCDPQRLCTAAVPSMVHSAPAVATATIARHTRARPVSGTRVLRSLSLVLRSMGHATSCDAMFAGPRTQQECDEQDEVVLRGARWRRRVGWPSAASIQQHPPWFTPPAH